jgi:hypothetical protein
MILFNLKNNLFITMLILESFFVAGIESLFYISLLFIVPLIISALFLSFCYKLFVKKSFEYQLIYYIILTIPISLIAYRSFSGLTSGFIEILSRH